MFFGRASVTIGLVERDVTVGLKFLFGIIVRRGDLTIIDASGALHKFGDGTGRGVTIRLADKWVERKLTFNPSLYLGETYMDGGLTIEKGSLRDLIELLMANLHRRWPAPLKFREKLRTVLRLIHQYNPASRSRRNVAHHYDLDGALYELFLGPDRHYSCAYHQHPDMSLEEAQDAKMAHIAAKLDISDGQRILDIGSGWGGLGLYLAGLGEVSVTGLTLSQEQLTISRQRAEREGMGDRVDFQLEDYRRFGGQAAAGKFDRIVSVGMFEHVGVGHYRRFFNKIDELLADDGVALLHSIGRFDGPGSTNPWLAKYIFPGGYVPALSEVVPVIERAGLYITDIEILRKHYAFTLKEWERRFQAHRDKAAALFDERFCRMWEFYLIASELSFLYQDMMVFQIQITKSLHTLPLTRDYMFAWEARHAPAPGRKNESAPNSVN
ncbi:Cyclopropane-fatty-acyl-phospholipid synthase [hydrothermal vent metagenome]|uniref:Cyclopropane-fatty-acyl-phospholipid synthase n=1 Tax=hydrothermal vent metagenome TaxID=652676 RepID=A0A3B0TEF4_9ZZZZ